MIPSIWQLRFNCHVWFIALLIPWQETNNNDGGWARSYKSMHWHLPGWETCQAWETYNYICTFYPSSKIQWHRIIRAYSFCNSQHRCCWWPRPNSRNDPITADNVIGSAISHQLMISGSDRIPWTILASIGSWCWQRGSLHGSEISSQ